MFSDCSQAYLESFLEQPQSTCLANAPDLSLLVGGPVCGNLFVERGEQCDCGPPEVRPRPTPARPHPLVPHCTCPRGAETSVLLDGGGCPQPHAEGVRGREQLQDTPVVRGAAGPSCPCSCRGLCPLLLPQECRNRCCNSTTCQLVLGAHCAHGTCCQECRVSAASHQGPPEPTVGGDPRSPRRAVQPPTRDPQSPRRAVQPPTKYPQSPRRAVQPPTKYPRAHGWQCSLPPSILRAHGGQCSLPPSTPEPTAGSAASHQVPPGAHGGQCSLPPSTPEPTAGRWEGALGHKGPGSLYGPVPVVSWSLLGQVKPAGELCRPQKDTCDLEEFCDGRHPECPEDAFQENGTPCFGGYCYNGSCPTLAQRCQALWGPGGHAARESCFFYDISPNCRGSRNRADMCGALQCQGGQHPPGRSSCILNHICHALTTEGGTAYEPVPEGTQCGPEKLRLLGLEARFSVHLAAVAGCHTHQEGCFRGLRGFAGKDVARTYTFTDPETALPSATTTGYVWPLGTVPLEPVPGAAVVTEA
ncbi:hypothetical protein P7K49_024802 [Saguinus oedipus]|uniref:Disintegrin domain-containing protein n=1 Tax=Saguinus oedipus TaxID=9490 RepID=A0ABQ9UR84_SAGOE|nr:hypothetical protein P7K49_024802 [Saguinus oedipus]